MNTHYYERLINTLFLFSVVVGEEPTTAEIQYCYTVLFVSAILEKAKDKTSGKTMNEIIINPCPRLRRTKKR